MTAAAPTWPNEPADFALIGFGVLGGVGAILWAGGWMTARLTGHAPPKWAVIGAWRMLTHPDDPTLAWGTSMPGPATYWLVTFVLAALVVAITVVLVRTWRGFSDSGTADPRRLPGTASASQVTAAAGPAAIIRRAREARPSLTRPQPEQVGYFLGRSRRRPAWASVEDSLLVVGPPRSGKGLHLVIPTILSAPGAVVTTSTRPDNLAATLTARAQRGPVAVFDPQRLAAGAPDGLAWSPIRGCEQPQTAMIRARGLAAGTGMNRTVDGGDFWAGQTESVLRGLLHAAALDDRPPAQLYRWSLDPIAATDAVTILARHAVAPGWDDALDAAIHADPRTRDSIWLGVRQALSALADPRVLAAVSPRDGEQFDPVTFLREAGTLYLLGTSAGASAAASLVAALVEDLVETARRLAASSPGARLDPPFLLALDEIGNLAPLPSLPVLMSEGGGSGITTLAVLQSLSQARDRWGEHQAGALWDAAIVKIVLGGGSNAHDLADLSALIGDRDEATHTVNRDARGGMTTSTSVRRVPVMDTARLRTLPFGTGVLLLRSAPPIVLALHPWTSRPDAPDLTRHRQLLEDRFREATTVAAAPLKPANDIPQ